jgi:hypothetical protein
MGRPSKYTPEVIERLITAIKLGAPYKHACDYARISFETLCQWQRKYPELVDQLKEAEGAAVVQWLAKIEKAASEGNWQAMAWKLERRYPESFGRKDKITVDVKQLDSDIERELALLTSGRQTDISGEAESETIN